MVGGNACKRLDFPVNPITGLCGDHNKTENPGKQKTKSIKKDKRTQKAPAECYKKVRKNNYNSTGQYVGRRQAKLGKVQKDSPPR